MNRSAAGGGKEGDRFGNVTAIRRKNRPVPVMAQTVKGGAEFLFFPEIEKTGVVRHLMSTRLGGVSEGDLWSMNVSYSRGDRKENVDENYRRIAEALGCGMEDFVFSDQTHTTNIRHVTGADRGKGILRPRDYADVDGMITDEPGIVLSTFYADCVPLLFVDPVKKAVGLSHSGWKGTAGCMGRKTVEAMQEAFGSRPEDILAGIGPSICRDCYEVSKDVAEVFQALLQKILCGKREWASGRFLKKREIKNISWICGRPMRRSACLRESARSISV